MRVLSLFSGIGAHDLGLEWAGMQIVGQVEIDAYCTKVLEKHWPHVKRWKDIATVSTNDLRRIKPDIICGGFPCQDISAAGRQRGLVEGEKSGLWREMWRVIRDVRPHWLLIENSPRLRTKGVDGILAALEALGYSCWPLVVGAIHVGAPQERQRVWIVACAESSRRQRGGQKQHVQESGLTGNGDALADADRKHGAGRAVEGKPAMVASAAISSEPSIDSGVMADADRFRIWQQSGWSTGASGTAPSFRFPALPGPVQHEWESPRVVAKSSMGSTAARNARRLAVRAIGNANPPQVVAMLGRAIMHVDAKRT